MKIQLGIYTKYIFSVMLVVGVSLIFISEADAALYATYADVSNTQTVAPGYTREAFQIFQMPVQGKINSIKIKGIGIDGGGTAQMKPGVCQVANNLVGEACVGSYVWANESPYIMRPLNWYTYTFLPVIYDKDALVKFYLHIVGAPAIYEQAYAAVSPSSTYANGVAWINRPVAEINADIQILVDITPCRDSFNGHIYSTSTNEAIVGADVRMILNDFIATNESCANFLAAHAGRSDVFCIPYVGAGLQAFSDNSGVYNFSTSTGVGNNFNIQVVANKFVTSTISYDSISANSGDCGLVQHDFYLEPNNKRTPIVIVPGILGSELTKDNVVIWPNIWNMISSADDSFMDVLLQDESGNPLDNGVGVTDVVREISVKFVKTDYLKGLIESLKSIGYVEGVDLFIFPYDWRLDINKHSEDLKNAVNEITSTTQSGKIDIVAHSTGGIIVKNMILQNREMENKIDRIVFVGVPHLGSPKAYKEIVYGDNLDIAVLNPEEVKKLAKNMTLLYELLPSQKYFDVVGSYINAYNPLNITWPYSDLNYNQTKARLISKDANANLLDVAEQLHIDALDSFQISPSSTLKIYNIVGCNIPTLTKIGERSTSHVDSNSNSTPASNEITEFNPVFTTGDGTVPKQSADYLNSSNVKKIYIKNTVHSAMLSENAKSRDFIVHLLTDSDPDSLLTILPSGVAVAFDNSFLLSGTALSIHSPVAINVYDQNNNHLGYATYTTTTGDGQTVMYQVLDQNIPGASYEQIGDNKFVFLPFDEENNANTYRVELDPYATGTFSMRVTNVNEDAPTKSAYFKDVVITDPDFNSGSLVVTDTDQPNTNFEYYQAQEVFDPNTNSTSTVYATSTIQATSVLEADQITDMVPPSTTLQISEGELNADNWSKTPVKFNLIAQDNLADNILHTYYRVSTSSEWQEYNGQMTIGDEGEYAVEYYSVDKAGNTERTQIKMLKIDLTPPEASIYFDPITEDLKITGEDHSNTDVIISTTTKTVLITDQSGNTIRFTLDKSITKITNIRNFTIKNLSYNGGSIADTAQTLTSSYLVQKDKKNLANLLLYSQTVKLNKNDILLNALYNTRSNQTIITGKNLKQILLLKKYAGLVNMTFETKDGKMELKNF
ncbi:MAG: hypothetical protein WC457_04025 [Patescibacteria group bacterium]